MGVRIIGTGHYVPEAILTNFDLEKMVDTSDEWITSRTGIKERHIAPKEMTTSDLALHSAQNALEISGISADQLDLIIVATVTPDYPFPSTACRLQAKLGAKNTVCFDLEAACSGLIYSLETARALLLANPQKYRYALVTGAEKLSSIVNWKDRSTCVLFGDAASTLILKNDSEGEDFMIFSKLGADGNYGNILKIEAGGSANPASAETVNNQMHYIKMAGPETFKLAVTSMVNSSREVMEKAGVTGEQIRWVIPHQANQRIVTACANRLSIPVDRVYLNLNRYGNTSSASIGICLDELNRAGKLRQGDLILLTSFGGGLTWGSELIRW